MRSGQDAVGEGVSAEVPLSEDERATGRARALEFGVEFLESVPDEILDPEWIAGLPVEWARTRAVLPVRWKGGVGLLMAEPGDPACLEEVALLLGREVVPLLAERRLIAGGIERCYFRRKESAEQFMQGLEPKAGGPGAGRERGEDLLQSAQEAPVTQAVNLILLEAVKARASDIHFEPFRDRLRVRYRVDGVLYEQASPPKHLEPGLISRLKVMAHIDIAEKRLPQDGMASVRVGEREIDIRVSTIPVAEGERVVLRLLNRESSLLPLGALGMPDRILAVFQQFLAESNGLVLVCGPTGSGKTTTLYAALRQVDTSRRNVITIEDPIEYQIPDIGQVPVKPAIGLTFARALRHILRQDPDVVLVGETRDTETAEIAVRASLTGHLVFTTLHTNDAGSSVIRLIDMGVEPYLVASALRGVLAQRLVRRLCPVCRRPGKAGGSALGRLGAAGRRLEGATVWEPVGCPECLQGYRGRLGLFELLRVDAETRNRIRQGGGALEELRTGACGAGFTLMDDALDKLQHGETSLEEVLSALGHTAEAG